MKEFDWSALLSALPSVTAIVAILVPAISSALASRSQERVKRAEMHAPHVYDALSEMTQAYSSLYRDGEQIYVENPYETMRATQARYEIFRTAAFQVLSLVPGLEIQQQISELLEAIRKNGFHVAPGYDTQFLALLNSVNAYMLSSKVKGTRKRKKR